MTILYGWSFYGRPFYTTRQVSFQLKTVSTFVISNFNNHLVELAFSMEIQISEVNLLVLY